MEASLGSAKVLPFPLSLFSCLLPSLKQLGEEGLVSGEAVWRKGWGLSLRLSTKPCVVSCVPQQKAKDNRAAHRINKVQKVSEWVAFLGSGATTPTANSLTALCGLSL